mgnify:CR=1 FL=1
MNFKKYKGLGIYLTPEFYNSKAWNFAGINGQRLFIDLHNGIKFEWVYRKVKGKKERVKEYTNHDQLIFSQDDFCKKYGCSNETYTRARNRLIECGLARITHKGGNGRGDYTTYKLCYLGGDALPNGDQERWRSFDADGKNWAYEKPKSNHRIGIKNRFQPGESGRTRKKIPTLSNDTLNGANPPIEKDTYDEGAY